MTTVMSGLARARTTDPGRPLVTFYDGASGERTELSVTTFDNWVTKIANLFSDELMLDRGDGIRIDLPTHWQTAVTALAAWTAGLVVVMPGASTRAAVSVVGPGALKHPDRMQGQVIACSLRPLGGRMVEALPAGWLDFALEVPGQPDLLLSPLETQPDDPALDQATGLTTHAELEQQAKAMMTELGVHPGGRLVTDADPSSTSGLLVVLVGPVVVGASVVLMANTGESDRARAADQERATAIWWRTG